MEGNVETVVGSTLYPFLRHPDNDKIVLMTVRDKDLGCELCVSVNFFLNKKNIFLLLKD